MNQRDLVYVSALFLLFGSFLLSSVTVTHHAGQKSSWLQSVLASTGAGGFSP